MKNIIKKNHKEIPDIGYNRFERYFFNNKNIWVCLHDEDLHFTDNNKPQIKLCSKTLRIRANDLWSKLPRFDKECMVAHELGHLEYQHYLKEGLFGRILDLLKNQPPTDEIEADRYACKIIGYKKYLDFLTERGNKVSIKENYLQFMDYNYRIKALKE